LFIGRGNAVLATLPNVSGKIAEAEGINFEYNQQVSQYFS
jgi:hypothetical protein